MQKAKLTIRINQLKENYERASKYANTDPVASLSALRAALECLVCIVWIRKIGVDFMEPSNSRNRRTLYAAMDDERFRKLFACRAIINDMKLIREVGNDAVHTRDLNDEAADMIYRFENCVKAVEKITGLAFGITSNTLGQSVTTATVENPSATASTIPVAEKPTPVVAENPAAATKEKREEAEVFWGFLREELKECSTFDFSVNFKLQNADILLPKTKKRPKLGVRLVLNFLIKEKYLRIGIYINDDTKYGFYSKLLPWQEEINSKIGKEVKWKDKGDRSEKTRWIETRLSFIPNSHADYARLANDAIPVIEKYIDVFTKYLPEAFKQD